MKRSKLIFAIALVFGAVLVPNGYSQPNGKLDEILANMQKAAGSITTIQAKMEHLKRDPNLAGKPARTNGKVFFKHPGKNNDKVKIVYSIPKGQTIWVVGDTITLYQAEINQAIITSRSAAAAKGDEFAFVATPYTSVPDLRRQYDIVYVGDDQGMPKLDLTPKAKSSINKLSLWVDQSSWLPVRYAVFEPGRETTFIISNVRKNQGVSDSTFRVDLPKGTKIVRR